MGVFKFYNSGDICIYNEGILSSVDTVVPSGNYRLSINGTKIAIKGVQNEYNLFSPSYAEITEIQKSATPDDNYLTIDEFIKATNSFFAGLSTSTIHRTTDAIIAKFNQVQESTTLAVEAVIDEWSIELTNVTGAIAGRYIVLFDPNSIRFSTFTQVGAPVGNVINLSSPIDFEYPIGTFVDISITNMAVDGSITPQIFGLRGIGTPEGVELTFHLTRVVMSCLCDSAVSLEKFANITALEKGLTLRSRNGKYHNIWNINSNREIDAIFGTDWKPYESTNPTQGQDGFTARLTFGGDEKMGTMGALPIGEDWEVIQPEDLTVGSPDITLLEMWAEGHIL